MILMKMAELLFTLCRDEASEYFRIKRKSFQMTKYKAEAMSTVFS